MVGNPIQFAVVCEDPRIEHAVLTRYGAKRALLVASGGCTALSLRALLPSLELVLVDPNPAQLELVRRKIGALEPGGHGDKAAARQEMFGIGHGSPKSLTQCGNFEALFSQLRAFLNAFVASDSEWRAFFDGGARDHESLRRWFSNRYWAVAFELFFSDMMLETMFTKAATQYAETGSYPGYFRERFERGLMRDDAATNYFLHHVFLGAYRDEPKCWPDYLQVAPNPFGIELKEARLEAIEDFSAFDCIDLSNTLDWMDETKIWALTKSLTRTAHDGAVVLYRQLNNSADHEARLAPAFEFDHEFARGLLANDRSLFYSSLHVGVRREAPGGRS